MIIIFPFASATPYWGCCCWAECGSCSTILSLLSSLRTRSFARPNTLCYHILTWVVYGCQSHQLYRFCWCFCLDNCTLLCLLCLLHLVLCSFCFLLGHLLCFNRCQILLSKCQVCNGQVVNDNVEMGSSFREEVPDSFGNLVSLGEELCCGKLSNHSSEDLVAKSR